MDFKIDRWLTKEKIRISLKSEKTKTKLNYVKASMLSLLFGILIGIIIIFANGYNGFGYFFELFKVAFDTEASGTIASPFDRMMNHFSSYIILALGLAMAFKLGLFNIGGSGQAVLGAGISIIMVANIEKATGVPFAEAGQSYIFLIFLIFVLSASLISALAGVLKVFFNIHEVVTTVMLNWTIWWFIRWIVMGDPIYKNQNQETKPLNEAWITIGDNKWILGIILAIICVGLIFFFLTFTTFGYKYNVVGKQQDAAKYAGINNKAFVITATAISGALIGIAAFIYYLSIEKKLGYSRNDLPTFGFDGISIALVAFNNIFGIIPISFLWAVIKSSATAATGNPLYNGLSNEAASLMFGAVIYGAAIYSVFYRFSPIEKIKLKLYKKADLGTYQLIKINEDEIKELKSQIKQIKKQSKVAVQEFLKVPKEQRTPVGNEMFSGKDLVKLEFKSQISILKGKINSKKVLNKILIEEGYKKYQENGLKGVKNWRIKNDNLILGTTLDELTEYVIERNHNIAESKESFKKYLKVSEKMNDSKIDDAILKQGAKQKFGVENAEENLKEKRNQINSNYKELLLDKKLKRDLEIKEYKEKAAELGEKSVIAYKKVIKVNKENYLKLLASVKEQYAEIEIWSKIEIENLKSKLAAELAAADKTQAKTIRDSYASQIQEIKLQSFMKKMEVKY